MTLRKLFKGITYIVTKLKKEINKNVKMEVISNRGG
jgi:hypothetical protein